MKEDRLAIHADRIQTAMVTAWNAIAADVIDGFQFEAKMDRKRKRITAPLLVEIVCDANRLETFGGLTVEEAAVVSAIYSQKKFQTWARRVMRGYEEVVEPPKPPRKMPTLRRIGTVKTPRKRQTYWERNGYTTYTGDTSKTPIRKA